MTKSRWAWYVPKFKFCFVLMAVFLISTQSYGWQESSELVESAAEVNTASNETEGINFLALLMRGGWFMVPLLALSLVVVAISLERFITLRRERIFPGRFVRQRGETPKPGAALHWIWPFRMVGAPWRTSNHARGDSASGDLSSAAIAGSENGSLPR